MLGNKREQTLGTASSFKGFHYTSFGTGRPIILLHGFGETSYCWRHLVPVLARKCRLFTVDLRGHGLSEAPHDELYSLEDQARVIYEFIEQFDLRDLTLIGHSMGGGIALILAIRMANEAGRLSSLILIDSIGFRQKMPLFVRLTRIPYLGYLGPALLPAKLQAKMILRLAYFDERKITPDVIDAYAANLTKSGGVYALVKTAQQLIPANIDAIVAEYHRITARTLLIWGREDRLIPPAIGIMLNTQIENSKLTILDDCGHCPHEEKPEVLVPAVRDFICAGQILNAN